MILGRSIGLVLSAFRWVLGQDEDMNLILVQCDAMFADDMGCAGHVAVRAPAVDRPRRQRHTRYVTARANGLVAWHTVAIG